MTVAAADLASSSTVSATPKLLSWNDVRRRAVVVLLFAWLYENTITQIQEVFIDAPFEWVQTIVSETIWTLSGMALSIIMFLVLERLQKRSFAIMAIAIVLMACAATFLHYNFYFWAHGHFYEVDEPVGLLAYYTGLYWAHYYVAWGAIMVALLLSGKSRAEQRMRAQAETVAHRARILALRYQLNPHFLFNTLNSVAALVLDNESKAAERMIRRLSSFLRRGLSENPLKQIALEKEVAHQLDYLAIEADRFVGRLAVDIDVPEELNRALVPGFILQPLFENAIKHGVAPCKSKITITLKARTDSGRLHLAVAEDSPAGKPYSTSGQGIGLTNVKQRLAELYGADATVEAGPLAGGGFMTQISLPLTVEKRPIMGREVV